MSKSVTLSPLEASALAAARRALAAGRLAEVAARYEQAARARGAQGADAGRHLRRALDFWVAAEEAGSGLACARRLLAARPPRAERGSIWLAIARLHLFEGRAEVAAREFQRARRLLSRDRDRRRQAALGEAEACMALGDATEARRLLERCRAESERAGDSWAASTALLRLGSLDLWMGDPLAARETLEEARALAGARHLISIEAESTGALAEADLALGRSQHALRNAEHAAHLLREMDRETEADRLLHLEGAALAARYEALEPGVRETAGPVLWRQALRRLGRARQNAVRDRRPVEEALVLLREAALLRASSGPRARERAVQAESRLGALGPMARHLALGARALAMAAGDPPAAAADWRRLARQAERSGAWRVAAEAWLSAKPADLPRAWNASARISPVEDSAPPVAARAALALSVMESAGEPEPRSGAFSWTLAARRAEHEHEAALLGGPRPRAHSVRRRRRRPGRVASHDRESTRLLFEAESRLARPAPARPARVVDDRIPRILPGESLVTLSLRRDEVEAWVANQRAGLQARIALGNVAEWRAAATALTIQVRDAAGWPDSVVPETLIVDSRRVMERLGASVWTPLWPALAGASRVIVVMDPAIPSLPWAGLLLAAPPVSWPRPRALCLVPSAALRRPPAWRLGPRQSLALAERRAEQPLAEREARAVARVLSGSWKALSPETAVRRGERGPLLDALRGASIHHWAPTITVASPAAALSRLPDGEAGVPLWRWARAGIRPRLVVMPRLEREEPTRIEVARIVGRVGPEGALRTTSARVSPSATAFPDAAALARALLAGGTSRALVNAWPFEAPASAGLVGSFYAGLARGDVPGEALFAAQRRAHEEGLHPAAWAGFSMWGWP